MQHLAQDSATQLALLHVNGKLQGGRRSAQPGRIGWTGVALGIAALLPLGLGTSSEATTTHTQSNLSEVYQTQGVSPGVDPKAVAQRWRQAEVNVVLDASLAHVSPAALALIEGSFQAWNDTGAMLPAVRFESGTGAAPSIKPDGKNTILVAPITYEGHENDLAITIGFSHPRTGEISEADIVINQKHVFKTVTRGEAEQSCRTSASSVLPADQESCTGSLASDACGESYDLSSVLTHEVGHFWGLGENYDDTQATMFSCTSACEVHKRDLKAVDVDEITALYDSPVREAGVGGCTIAHGTRHPTPWPQGAWMLCALLAATATTRRLTSRRP
jgi:hypothetical protein